ncbi:MAG: MazG family protein, partial [Bacillales bacterium]
WEKVKEELREFEQEMEQGGKDGFLEKEFGDLLFALVNVARFYKINPEEALFAANQKFLRRFSHVEKRVKESGKTFADFTLEELDKFWDEAKENGL